MLAVLLAATLAPAAPALATQRYATPTGSGTACTQVAPCAIDQAINNANASDEVLIAGNQGTYGTAAAPLSTPLFNGNSGLNIHGIAGQPRPQVFSNVSIVLTLNSGPGTLSDVDLEGTTPSSEALQTVLSVDHVVARGGSSVPGCVIFDGGESLADTLCVGGQGINENETGAGSSGSMALHNVTAIGLAGQGISLTNSNETTTLTATNVIARGTSQDIAASNTSPGGITVTLDHSNYATVSAGARTTITPQGTGSNQTAAPAFVNAAGGDYHETLASPTVDAGANDPASGSTDLDGLPRTIGPATDIGAYEAIEAPALSVSPPTAVTQTSATVNATINPNAAATTYSVNYGPTASYGTSTPAQPLAASTTASPVSVALAGLSPGTTYHYRVLATNSAGTSATTDQTFTTSPAPIVPVSRPAPGPRRSILSLLIGGTLKVRHGRVQVALACAATGTDCVGKVSLTQRVRGSRVVSARRRARTRTVVLGRASYRVRSGKRGTVSVRLTGSALRSLSRAPGHRRPATVRVTDTTGTGAARRVTLVLVTSRRR